MDKCYKCGKTGHIRSECYSYNEKCFKCNKEGHRKSECKASNIKCYNCGKEGHISKECKYDKSIINGDGITTTIIDNKIFSNKDVYFLLDVSSSMGGAKLNNSKRAIIDLVNEMCKKDRIALVTFDSKAFFKIKPRPVEEVLRKNDLDYILPKIFADGFTAIYDAIHLSASQIHNKDIKTIMIVLTDGEDNSSRISYNSLLDYLKQYPNISLNIVDIQDGIDNSLYKQLASQNGGTYQVIKETDIEVTIKTLFKIVYSS